MKKEINDTDVDLLAFITEIVYKELDRATKKFGPFASAHEGYAIMLEELDELWEAIKQNDDEEIAKEATQVAAMSLRFLHDLILAGRLSKEDYKCL